MFAPDRLTLGVFFPIEAFCGDQPTMLGQEGLARRAEELGYAALWCRDVPLRDPGFGDLVLTLRHPLHTAKGVASVDRLSGNRLVLGVASGDRPVEFPAFGVDFEQRSALFRDNLRVVRASLAEQFPQLQSSCGTLAGTADIAAPSQTEGRTRDVTAGPGGAPSRQWDGEQGSMIGSRRRIICRTSSVSITSMLVNPPGPWSM
jgi:alkanesulfonate monooxygenase SsuD/methylene tetrahydromethanopterin reductase-like flavin-dependent oxidoreductase (luciferase family)